MISIRDMVYSSNSDVRNLREIRRDQRIREIYGRYPELETIDKEIVSARTTGLIAIIDNNTVEQSHSTNLEKQLLEKRARFIARNDIDPDFDAEKIICPNCNDTGFYKNKSGLTQVCNKCRQNEIDECCALSGMRDYSMIKLDNYKDDYFGNKRHRMSIRRSLIEIVVGSGKHGASGISIYSDGVQTGKTFLAVYTAKLAINLGYSAYYMRLDDIASMDEDGLDDLRDYDILIIDDYIASITMAGMTGTKLNSVLESRIAKGLPSVIVTSFPIPSLISESDVRISGKIKKAKVIAAE